MSLSVSSSLYSLMTLQGSAASRASGTAVAASDVRTADKKNLPVLTEDGKSFKSPGTQLTSETQQELENGSIRRTQVFEREDGRSFTRVEDFTLTERGAKRTVYQQNPSGSITQYEEVLDREPSGNFRRTQRFRDETGEIATQITSGYQVTDSFVLTGEGAPRTTPSPFQPTRGTQLDLQA